MPFRFIPLALLPAAICAQPQTGSLPAFEVASIRLTPPASLGNTSPGAYGTNRYAVTNAPLYFLVQLAYGVTYQQISGIDKLGSEHYDLNVKAEDGVILTYEQLKPRMQRLLAERFKLAFHREEKTVDGYALVVARNGPKLKANAGAREQGGIYPGGLRLSNLPLSGFATLLRSPAGRPVVDKTGISGNYDFTLNYARDGDVKSNLPSFFTALQEQLGLKLEPAKVPQEILVIEHVEKLPTEN